MPYQMKNFATQSIGGVPHRATMISVNDVLEPFRHGGIYGMASIAGGAIAYLFSFPSWLGAIIPVLGGVIIAAIKLYQRILEMRHEKEGKQLQREHELHVKQFEKQ